MWATSFGRGTQRRTSHILQFGGAEESGASYCVPHVTQIARSSDSNFIVVVYCAVTSECWIAQVYGLRKVRTREREEWGLLARL